MASVLSARRKVSAVGRRIWVSRRGAGDTLLGAPVIARQQDSTASSKCGEITTRLPTVITPPSITQITQTARPSITPPALPAGTPRTLRLQWNAST